MTKVLKPREFAGQRKKKKDQYGQNLKVRWSGTDEGNKVQGARSNGKLITSPG